MIKCAKWLVYANTVTSLIIIIIREVYIQALILYNYVPDLQCTLKDPGAVLRDAIEELDQ